MTDLPPPPSSPPIAPPAGASGGWQPAPGSPDGSGSGVIGGVVAIAVATLVVLAGLVVWGGGGAASATLGVPGSPAGLVPDGLPSGGLAPGSASSRAVPVPGTRGTPDGPTVSPVPRGSSNGTVPTDPGADRPGPAIDPAALTPPGGAEVPPTRSDVARQWQVTGQDWPSVLDRYKQAFPIAGYRLGRHTVFYGNESGSSGEGWTIVDASGTEVGRIAVHVVEGGAVLVEYSEPS